MRVKIIKLFVISFYLCIPSWMNAQPTDADPGKCYAKCPIAAPLLPVTEEFYEFNDKYSGDVLLDSVYFFHELITDRWIYLGYFNELTEAQQENEEKFYKMIEVLNVELTESYMIDTIDFYTSDLESYDIEWVEVYCSGISKDKYRSVAVKLSDLGFLRYSDIRNIDAIKKALVSYQRATGLAPGAFTVETVDRLLSY